jgi:hypothetical protein
MDKLWQFACEPTRKKWDEIQKSDKLKNNLGDAFSAWENSVLISMTGEMEWPTFTEDELNKRLSLKSLDNIDVISKLIARPCSSLLMKAWCLFLADGKIKYLGAAYEVAGNMRAGDELKREAIKIYTEIRGYYTDYILFRKLADVPPCVKSFSKYESLIDEKRQLLAATHQNVSLARRTIADNAEISVDELLNRISAHEHEKPTVVNKPPISRQDDQPSTEELDAFEAVARDVVNKIK